MTCAIMLEKCELKNYTLLGS